MSSLWQSRQLGISQTDLYTQNKDVHVSATLNFQLFNLKEYKLGLLVEVLGMIKYSNCSSLTKAHVVIRLLRFLFLLFLLLFCKHNI